MNRTYKISDVVNEEFLRFPVTLLANPKYLNMSIEAKFVYTLLFNRMTLSQKNGWINDKNEVYLIYTREDVAVTLNISYKKSIAAFKELIENDLLIEQRQGRGYPNLLYVLKAEISDQEASEFKENFDETEDENGEKEPENPVNKQICQNGTSRSAKTACLELPKSHIKKCQNGISRTADSEYQDMPNLHPSNINNINIKNSHIEKSQSVSLSSGSFKDFRTDGPTDDEEKLQMLLGCCELDIFSDDVRDMFVKAIERLYYSEYVTVGKARLPQAKIRSYLWNLDVDKLLSVVETMRKNEDKIINPTGYLMSSIVNEICEVKSDLILNMPQQYIDTEDLYAPPD